MVDPPAAGLVRLGFGQTIEVSQTIGNKGDQPLIYAATLEPTNFFASIIEGSNGSIPAGGVPATIRFRFTCTQSIGFDTGLSLNIASNAGTVQVPIRVVCLAINLGVVTNYNGPQDDCTRVLARANLGTDVWQNAAFNVFIDGVRSTYTDISQFSQNIFQFNLTRACNLTVGQHQLLIRFTDSGTGIVTEAQATFNVVDNRWPGVAFNDTNRCEPGLGVTLASITSRAPGETDQVVTNIAAGSTGRFVARPGLTYTYRGVAANPAVYDQQVNGRFGGGVPIEGNPSPINGRLAYFGVYFVRGSCARRAGQDAAMLGEPMGTSQVAAYFQSFVK
ncbi:MAG: hypothetical protein HC933_15020 [Pleurocapsa sp. SU_196_0]|nr:hypothetical protein [Pleurocapsa sp. SU_196_0]